MPSRSSFDVKQQRPKLLPDRRHIYIALGLGTDPSNRLWPELNYIVASFQGQATAIPSPDPTALRHCRTNRQAVPCGGIKRVLARLRDTFDDPLLAQMADAVEHRTRNAAMRVSALLTNLPRIDASYIISYVYSLVK
jgi:hypothetical protein